MAEHNPFRYFFKDSAHFVYLAMRLWFRPRVIDTNGHSVTPKIKGCGLVAANHTGFDDPFVLGAVFWRRRIYFLTAKEVMATSAREFWLTKAGCIKIDRSISDMAAIRNCVDVCKQGNLLGIFPAGHIQANGETDRVKSGAILIALQANAPILPLYSQKPPHRWQRRLVVLGEPFYPTQQCNKKFPSMQDIEQLSAELQTKIEECKITYESHC